MTQSQNRTTRVAARIAPETLSLVRRAAELQGRSISDFMVAAAFDAAHRAIAEAQIIQLSVEDQRAFAAAIVAPPEPGDALRRAAKAYRTLITAAE